jgi:hypothetical protein
LALALFILVAIPIGIPTLWRKIKGIISNYQKPRTQIMLVILLILLCALIGYLYHFNLIDECLDRGGAWDEKQNICDYGP